MERRRPVRVRGAVAISAGKRTAGEQPARVSVAEVGLAWVSSAGLSAGGMEHCGGEERKELRVGHLGGTVVFSRPS